MRHIRSEHKQKKLRRFQTISFIGTMALLYIV